MSAVVDLVALTLLPLGRWRTVAEQLQAGHPAPVILEPQCDDWASERATRSPCPGAGALRSRATKALDRADRTGLQCLPWTDARFPSVLRTIADPPPVLWLRGSPSVFDPCSVA